MPDLQPLPTADEVEDLARYTERLEQAVRVAARILVRIRALRVNPEISMSGTVPFLADESLRRMRKALGDDVVDIAELAVPQPTTEVGNEHQ